MATQKIVRDSVEEMKSWIEDNKNFLIQAVAKFAIFCTVECYNQNKFIKHAEQNLLFCRRKAKQKEKRGETGNVYGMDIIWDDNSAINYRFKALLNYGKSQDESQKFKNYTVCHVYSGLSHNPLFFSSTANIVLLPNTLAGLSDHCDIIKDLLAHRVYQMFKWYPETEGFFIPEYNKDFINLPWKDQVSDEVWESDKPQDMERRLERWAQKKDSIVYKTIQFVKEEKDGISRKDLITKLSNIANNPRVTISSLMSETGNSYGNLFYGGVDDTKIKIRKDFQKIIDELWI